MAGPKRILVHESLAVCPEVGLTGLWTKGHYPIMKLKRKDMDGQNLIAEELNGAASLGQVLNRHCSSQRQNGL